MREILVQNSETHSRIGEKQNAGMQESFWKLYELFLELYDEIVIDV